jgi:hypothetical protein
MNNVHDDRPILFETRWTLSYLAGPLTRSQIQELSGGAEATTPAAAPAGVAASMGTLEGTASAPSGWPTPPAPAAATGASPATSPSGPSAPPAPAGRTQPIVPPQAGAKYAAPRRSVPAAHLVYQPALLGEADLHFDGASDVDVWETRSYLAPLGPDAGPRIWETGQTLTAPLDLGDQPEAGAGVADLPAIAL